MGFNNSIWIIIMRMNRIVFRNRDNNKIKRGNSNIMNWINFILDSNIMMDNRINRVEYNNYRDNIKYYWNKKKVKIILYN